MKFRLVLAGLAVLVATPALALQPSAAPGANGNASASSAASASSSMPATSGNGRSAAPAATAGGETPLPPGLDPENVWLLDLSTGGRVAIRLRPEIAPRHVERIKELTRRGFYDGQIFHRVIEGFMAQTGDPTGTGQGGSDLPLLVPEFNEAPHVRGTVSMARAEGLDSANSQFFIMFQPMLRLDRNYTVFGRVVAGMQWVDKIERGEPPAHPSRILQASIAADHKPAPDFQQAQPDSDASLLMREAAKLQQSAPAPSSAEEPQEDARPMDAASEEADPTAADHR